MKEEDLFEWENKECTQRGSNQLVIITVMLEEEDNSK